MITIESFVVDGIKYVITDRDNVEVGDLVVLNEEIANTTPGSPYKVVEVDSNNDPHIEDDYSGDVDLCGCDYEVYTRDYREALAVGDYAMVIGSTNGFTSLGDIVKVVDEDGSSVPYRLTDLDGEYQGWQDPISLRKLSDSELKFVLEELRNKKEDEERVEKKLSLSVGDYAVVVSPLFEYQKGDVVRVVEGTSRYFDYAVDRLICDKSGEAFIDDELVRKITKEEYEERKKWADIGRKYGEYRVGDIVEILDTDGGHPVGTIGAIVEVFGSTIVEACGSWKHHSTISGKKLIVPAENRFDK